MGGKKPQLWHRISGKLLSCILTSSDQFFFPGSLVSSFLFHLDQDVQELWRSLRVMGVKDNLGDVSIQGQRPVCDCTNILLHLPLPDSLLEYGFAADPLGFSWVH